MTFRSAPRSVAWFLAVAGMACTPPVASPPRTTPVAAEPSPATISLPAVPRVLGRLVVRVVYPPDGATIAVRDSTFIFGSVGSGDASLRINGQDVPVLPNGSFLGWLPVPPRDNPAFNLVVARNADTARVSHRIRLPAPRPALPPTGALVVDSASLQPRGTLWRRRDESVRVSVRAPRNAVVRVTSPAGAFPLGPSTNDSTLHLADVPARYLADQAVLVVSRHTDSIVLALPRVTLVDPERRVMALSGVAPSTLPDTDRVTSVRPIAGGTYKWFLLPGTQVPVTGRQDGAWRIALDGNLDGWVDAADMRLLDSTVMAPVRVAGNARVVAGNGWSDVVIPVGAAPPWAVEIGERSLELTLYGTVANTDIINYATRDSLVERITWEQVTSDRARYVITLRHAPYGYLARYERGAFALRIRSAPRVDPRRPLAGITIAVDAGHPPGGSTGPTGLYEAVATLPIAERLRSILEARGATVVMTRTGPSALGLPDRPSIARQANAHAFISIHLNALPDGVNPFRAHGTGTYYFTGQSVPLARQVQRGMVRTMGLRDLGINYDNLAVVRPTWMPSILCEGAFVMIPEQEAALRTPEFQDAYATGVADGIEAYFRSLATGS
ncbi:MAG: N-acetylmuramoyl-L-alanine amidase [Cytophagaceae bacterium]|nr:N-acetylmuramoyl-L-alanine amidase [Gemmatimonadaceae bacterium]